MNDPPSTASKLAVLHCVYREGLASVFESQVLKPVRALREAGVDVGLVTMAPVGEWFRSGPRQAWRARRQAIAEAMGGGKFTRLPSPPARFREAWDDRRTFAAWHRRVAAGYDVLHCRGSAMTNIALDARRRTGDDTPIIFDCRGVDHAEHVYSHGIRDGQPIPDHLQPEWQQRRDAIARAVEGADAIICVSAAMADHLADAFGAAGKPMVVCPCAVETGLFRPGPAAGRTIREELGLADRIVVVYCGSTREWQLPDQSIAVFQRIQQHDPSAFFLVVTPQQENMRQRLREAGLAERDYHVTLAAHDRVPAYLGAGDVGLLLREPCLVNRVASPVKFAEYVAAGLPVVMTEQVGDYSDLAERERLGCVLPYAQLGSDADEPLASFVASVRSNRDEWRSRCQRTAEQQLSLAQHRDRVLDLYQACTGRSSYAAGRASASEDREKGAA